MEALPARFLAKVVGARSTRGAQIASVHRPFHTTPVFACQEAPPLAWVGKRPELRSKRHVGQRPPCRHARPEAAGSTGVVVVATTGRFLGAACCRMWRPPLLALAPRGMEVLTARRASSRVSWGLMDERKPGDLFLISVY